MINILDSKHNQSQTVISNFVNKCLDQYQEKINEEGQFSDYDEQHDNLTPDQIFAEEQSLKYYGYEDKKSITIKPIKMHKDFISLKKQNQQKKKVIQDLQKQNLLLKNKYQKCMNENQKVQKFLKDIQFTFKNDKKAQKANQIMLKAKRMLYREAIQCQNNAKRITKSAQANTIQQIKMYIQFLTAQRTRLQQIIQTRKNENDRLRDQQDFNIQNQQKFEQTMQHVEKMLNIQIKRSKRHHQIYKIQKGMVSTGLKQKEIMLKKKSIEKYYQKLKDLMLTQQGEQYQIVVLEKKRKDKIKLIQQMKQFKNQITFKKSSIQQFQKEMKQKLKTYDYMSKWTKQLKAKLQEKKQNHISNKITFEKKINALSREFEQWNKKYKMELVEQQLGHNNSNTMNGVGGHLRKKGSTAKQIYFGNGKDFNTKEGHNADGIIDKRIRIIKIEQIRMIVKKIKLWILQNQIDLESFIKQKILKWKDQNSEQVFKNVRNVSFINQGNNIVGTNNRKLLDQIGKNTISSIVALNSKKPLQLGQKTNDLFASLQAQAPKITLKQLYQNLRQQFLVLNDQSDVSIMKIARYIVEQNGSPCLSGSKQLNTIKTNQGMVVNLSISKKIAYTIIYKLFQNELKTYADIQLTKTKFKQFLIKFYDPFRYDVLKMLLHMGGLQSLQKNQHNNQTGVQLVVLNTTQMDKIQLVVLNTTQMDKNQPKQRYGDKSISCEFSTNNNSLSTKNNSLNSMRKNQQLHLQLQLDQAILLLKLKKHVVQQYYVVRYKQLIDFMIYQEFGQIHKQRLGMLDRICQITTGKKLIKENIDKNYNFDCVVVDMENTTERKCSEIKYQYNDNNKQVSSQKERLDKDYQQHFKQESNNVDEEQYWIVPNHPNVSTVNIQIDDYKEDKVRKNTIKKKTWLNDLMSDQQQSDYNNQSNDNDIHKY